MTLPDRVLKPVSVVDERARLPERAPIKPLAGNFATGFRRSRNASQRPGSRIDSHPWQPPHPDRSHKPRRELCRSA